MESRRQNRRIWSSPVPTSTSRIPLKMEQFSQSACCTLAEDLGHLKGQEKSHNWVGLKEEKKEKEKTGLVPAPLVGAEGQKVPALRKPPYHWADQLGQKRSFRSLEESTATDSVTGRTDYKTNMDVPLCSPACSSLSCCLLMWRGLGAGMWGLEVDTRRRQLLAVKRQPARMGVRSSTTGNVPGRSLGPKEAGHHC